MPPGRPAERGEPFTRPETPAVPETAPAPSEEPVTVNWAGVLTIFTAVFCAHWLVQPHQPIEVLTSLACVLVIYPALRLTVFRPHAKVAQ